MRSCRGQTGSAGFGAIGVFSVALSLAAFAAGGSTPVFAQVEVTAPPAPAVPPGPASEGGFRYVTYGDAVALALRENVDLQAIRNQEEAFKLRSKQALAPNNPVFSLGKVDVAGFSLTQMAAEQTYALNFTLGFPGKALAQSASLRHQAEATSEQAIAKEIDLMTALSNNYVAFANNDALYQLLLDEQKRDHDLMRLLEKKYAASQAAKVDLLNAEVVSQTIAQNILENRNDHARLVTEFHHLIRRPDDRSLLPMIPRQITIPPVRQSFDDLEKIMLDNRHLLRSAQKQVESTQAALASASLMPFPDLQLTAGVNVWNSPSAEPNPGVSRDYTFGISIAVPLFFPFNEVPGINAARHDLAAAENQLDSARLQAISDLQTTYTGLTANQQELANLNRLVVPAAKASYDLTLLTYGLGKADYFRLNEARRTWLDAERDLLAKRLAAAQFYNQLIAQVGCDIAQDPGKNTDQNGKGPHACKF